MYVKGAGASFVLVVVVWQEGRYGGWNFFAVSDGSSRDDRANRTTAERESSE